MIKTLIATLLLAASIKAGQLYNIEDLNVLNKDKSYREFLTHAYDIRPSKRDKKWEKMLKDMANGHVEKLLKDKTINDKEFLFIESLASKKVLAADDFFQLKRTQFAYEYFKTCQSNCTKQFSRFIKSAPVYTDYDYKFLEVFRNQDIKISQKLTLRIAQSSVANFYCNKKHIYDIVIANINHKHIKTINAADIKKIVRKTASDDCLIQFTPFIKEELFSKNATSRTRSLFLIANAYNLISNADEDIFYTLYILNGPEQGKILNRAWTRIEKISQDHKRREKVLKYLNDQVHLPDHIFSYNEEKRKIYIKFFDRNFPEYIKLYTDRCINYMEGNGDFPLGNPTFNCNKFMTTYKNTKQASDRIIMRYSGAKKY